MSAELPPGGGAARIVLVDDHELARDGLRDMFADVPNLEVVGEAADGREALELCRRVRPNLVLMDLRMPRMDGLAATRAIKGEFPGIIVLVMTLHEDPDYLLQALQAGAGGYVLKDAAQDEVLSAVGGVLSGESPLAPELAARLLRRLAAEVREPAHGLPPSQRRAQMPEPLTPREMEVLELLAHGKTNRQIAEDFVLSVGTVKNHVEHIIAKFGVSDRTQAVVRALELGLISFPGQ